MIKMSGFFCKFLGNLNNEKWHQIVAQVLEQGTRLQVNNKEIMIHHKRFKKKQEKFDKEGNIFTFSYFIDEHAGLVSVVGNEVYNSSSNPTPGCLYFT